MNCLPSTKYFAKIGDAMHSMTCAIALSRCILIGAVGHFDELKNEQISKQRQIIEQKGQELLKTKVLNR